MGEAQKIADTPSRLDMQVSWLGPLLINGGFSSAANCLYISRTVVVGDVNTAYSTFGEICAACDAILLSHQANEMWFFVNDSFGGYQP